MSGISRGARAQLVDLECSDPATVQCLAYRNGGGTVLWLANLSAQAQSVTVSGGPAGGMIGTLLDEASFELATTDPKAFQRSHRPMKPKLTLEPYAVAILALGAS